MELNVKNVIIIGVVLLFTVSITRYMTQRTHDKYQKIQVEHQLNKK